MFIFFLISWFLSNIIFKLRLVSSQWDVTLLGCFDFLCIVQIGNLSSLQQWIISISGLATGQDNECFTYLFEGLWIKGGIELLKLGWIRFVNLLWSSTWLNAQNIVIIDLMKSCSGKMVFSWKGADQRQ